MQRPWRSTDYWVPPHGLLSLLSYRTQDHLPRAVPLTMGWALSYPSLVNEMIYRLAYSSVL